MYEVSFKPDRPLGGLARPARCSLSLPVPLPRVYVSAPAMQPPGIRYPHAEARHLLLDCCLRLFLEVNSLRSRLMAIVIAKPKASLPAPLAPMPDHSSGAGAQPAQHPSLVRIPPVAPRHVVAAGIYVPTRLVWAVAAFAFASQGKTLCRARGIRVLDGSAYLFAESGLLWAR